MENHRTIRDWHHVFPDETYSVREASKYLDVHRCTIYAYITHPERRLPFFCSPDSKKKQFRGADLIAFKAAGLPKKGRKRKNRKG